MFRDHYLESIGKVLKKGGTVRLYVPKEANASKTLMFAGFDDITNASVNDTHEIVSGSNPEWEAGASETVTLALKPKADVWSLANDLDDGAASFVFFLFFASHAQAPEQARALSVRTPQ
jgi:hypothetical protein